MSCFFGCNTNKSSFETQVESLIQNSCGSVTCQNVSNRNIIFDPDSTINGRINLSQTCAAKKICAFRTTVDAKVKELAKSAQEAGFLSTSTNSNESDIRNSLINTIQSKCGPLNNANIDTSTITFRGTLNGDIDLSQAGNATLDCSLDSLFKMDVDSQSDNDQKNTGALKFLENLTSNPIFIVVAGLVVYKLLGGGGSGRDSSSVDDRLLSIIEAKSRS